MSNIITAKVRIRGVRPLWWHAFGPDALPLEKQEKQGVAGNNPQEWRNTVLCTKEGQLCVDGSYMFGCLKEGGKRIKVGRGNIVKDIAATLQIGEERILVNRFFPGFPNGNDFNPATVDTPSEDSDFPVYLDVRGVVNPSTKGRNIRYRIAAAPGWEMEFTLVWDKTVVARHLMEAALIDAGKLAGIGSGRAIGKGRFEVVSFEVIE